MDKTSKNSIGENPVRCSAIGAKNISTSRSSGTTTNAKPGVFQRLVAGDIARRFTQLLNSNHLDRPRSTIQDWLTLSRHSISELIDASRFKRGYRQYWNGEFESAWSTLEPLAAKNDCAAQYYLGRMRARGEGIDKDLMQALRWWNASAGRGERWAQVEIGNLYENGRGIAQDSAKALKWYRRAADDGLAEAQVRVGYFYDKGIGVTLNHNIARQWYIRAAVQGEKNAYHNLAVHYARGLGVPADKQKALAWLKKAQPHQRCSSDDVVGLS